MEKTIKSIKIVLKRFLSPQLVEIILKELRQELLKERDAA